MLNHPDMEEQGELPAPGSGKLVLPALPNTPGSHDTPGGLHTLRPHRPSTDPLNESIAPGLLIRSKEPPAPQGLLPKLAYYWRKDPAYKVFILAVVTVVAASIVFVSMASAAWLSKPFINGSYSQTAPTSVAPTGTVDLRPTFSAPGGGKGSSQSSQPPVQSTPVLTSTPSGDGSPTPQPSPTQPGQGGDLTAQIVDFSAVVDNGSRAFVSVATNEPGVTVTLFIRSNASPRFSTAGPQITDGDGNVTITWFVYYTDFGRRSATLSVTAVATDQNGQRTTSSPVTIQVLLQGMP
jgi:hypothetical protein